MQDAVDYLRARLRGAAPRAAVVLGSGLGRLARGVEGASSIPFARIPGFPPPGVPGHAGEIVAGRIDGVEVLFQRGRFHLYEGHPPAVVARPVHLYASLGIETLVLTNAAGCLRPLWRPPSLMLVADHVNWTGRNPLVGRVRAGEERFPDMSEPYDRGLRAAARRTALAEGIPLHEGVYAAVLGPSYETPAEVRMLARLGIDAVGMSTVPEVLAARALGMRVLALSCLTNLAAGLAPAGLAPMGLAPMGHGRTIRHDDVLEAGSRVAASLEGIVRGVLRAL